MGCDLRLRQLNIRQYLTALSAFFLACCLSLHALQAQTNSQGHEKYVLVIQSYHSGMNWSDQINLGIKEVLNQQHNIPVYTEYLDSKRYPLSVVSPNFVNTLNTKYKTHPPAVIIAVDNNALAFMQTNGEKLSPGIPVVFCGINGYQPSLHDQLPLSTGVVEKIDPVSTVNLANQLLPDLKRLIVVSGKSTSTLLLNQEVEQALGGHHEHIKIDYWRGLDLKEVAAKADYLDAESDAILLVGMTQQSPEGYVDLEKSAEMIAQYSTVPVFVLHDYAMGDGVLGGKVVAGLSQGRAAAGIAHSLLSGKSLKELPVQENSPNVYMIDENVMQRFELGMNRLPADTIILNQHLTLWEQYGKVLTWIFVVMIAEAIALLLLGIFFYLHKNRSTRRIQSSETRYAIAQDAAHICSWEWDLIFDTIYWTDQAESVLGIDPKHLNHDASLFYARVHPEDLERLQGLVNITLSHGESLNVEFRFRAKDGSYEWKQSRGEVIRDENRKIIKLMGITQDVTERRRMEKLYESFYQAMRASRTPILITDIQGEIRHANPAFNQLFGLSTAEILDHPLYSISASKEYYLDLGYSEDEYAGVISELKSVLEEHQKGEWQGRLYCQKKSGNIISVNLYINAIYGAQKEVMGYVAMPIDVTEQEEEQHLVLMECYRALSDLAETRDDETGNHLRRISSICANIAREMGMSQKFCKDIEIYSPLHDIGKVGIPDAILLAPRKLTAEEYDIMKTHADLGHRILDGRPTLEMAADIARWHHEHWDGHGYPDQISGEQIPLSARIMAVADVYDALRSKRRYKDGWTHQEAMDYLESKAGSQFDPQVIEAFAHVCDKVSSQYDVQKVETLFDHSNTERQTSATN